MDCASALSCDDESRMNSADSAMSEYFSRSFAMSASVSENKPVCDGEFSKYSRAFAASEAA